MGLKKHYLDVIKILHHGQGRPFIDKVIDILDKEWERKNVFIIEAPTGYGKTAISLSVAKYSVEEELKAVIAYPLRALLRQQARKFRDFFRGCGHREKLIGVRYMMMPESPYLVRSVTLTTIDTLALTAMGISPTDLNKVSSQLYEDRHVWGSMGHYVFAWASTFTSNIVVDEAHLLADSGKALTFLSFLAEATVFHNQHLIVMTATMPSHLPKTLGNIADSNKVVEISFTNYLRSLRSGNASDKFVDERLRKEYEVETLPASEEGVEVAMEWVSEVIKVGDSPEPPRVLAVFNTVEEAIKAYHIIRKKLLGNRCNGIKVMLIHSRFTAKDRERLANELNSLSQKAKEERNEKPYVIIATQSVEAGVDITSNILVTDAAPPTTIIQRAGRFLRYEEKKGRVLLWWDAKDGDLRTDNHGIYKVYDAGLVRATIGWVTKNKGKVNLHLPETALGRPPGYTELLAVYKPLALKASADLKDLMEDVILDYLGGSKRAAQLLEEFGGSFIRDSTLVPVIPKGLVNECNIKQPSELVVPLTPLKLLGLYSSGKVVGVLKGSDIRWRLSEQVERMLKKARQLARGRPALALRYITKVITYFDIDSFLVDADYNPEEGLRV